MVGCGGSTRSLDIFLHGSGLGTTVRDVNVYCNAYVWFRQRELAGYKVPGKLKLAAYYTSASIASKNNNNNKDNNTNTTDNITTGTTTANTSTTGNDNIRVGSSSSSSSSSPSSLSTREAALQRAITAASIDELYLDGEEADSVPIYDSCDEIRRKIEEHLSATLGLSATQFCRNLAAQLLAPENEGRNISWGQLASFRKLKGPRTGAKSIVFYVAYVYFEKLRIVRGEAKSEHREIMEELWEDECGFSRDVDHRTELIWPFILFYFIFLLPFSLLFSYSFLFFKLFAHLLAGKRAASLG